MTDRTHALSVTLENHVRADDVKPLMEAIRQMRGVLRVDAHVADVATYAAEGRGRHIVTVKVLDALREAGKSG